MHLFYINIPTITAVNKEANVPAIKAKKPNLARSTFLFGDNAPQSRRAAERLVTDLGLKNITGNMYDLQGTTTLQHDKLIGMFSALFIGNTISTFSGVIAYTRVSLGRDPDTNIGLLI